MWKGQTLIEVLVALGVAVVVLTAVTVAVLTALNNSQYSKLQNQATQYSQQGMEFVQAVRDARTLATYHNNTYCMPASCTGANNFTNCFLSTADPACTDIDGIFQRDVTFSDDSSHCGSDVKNKVSVTVKWSDGKCNSTTLCHSVQVTSCMADSVREGL